MPLFRKKSDRKSTAVAAKTKGTDKKGHKRVPSQTSIGSASDILPNGDLGFVQDPGGASGGAQRPQTLLLNLDHMYEDGTNSLKPETPLQTSSRLSKTLQEVLHDKDALPYLIQFMGSKGVEPIIKFWLDAESFQASSWTRIRSHSQASISRAAGTKTDASSPAANCNSSAVNKPEMVKGDISCTDSRINGSSTWTGQPSDSTVKQAEQVNSDPSVSTGSKSTCASQPNNTTGASANESAGSGSVANHIASKDTGHVSSAEQSNVSNGRVTEGPRASAMSDSASTAGTHSGSDTAAARNAAGPPAAPQTASAASPTDVPSLPHTLQSSKSPQLDVDNEDSLQEKLRTSIEKDAVCIYSKYISHDAPQAIPITEQLRQETIKKICREDGQVDPLCFVACQDFVIRLMDKDYYPEFVKSEYFCKHQVDLLTGTRIYLADILYKEEAMFYFMEFMEQENASSLLRFWVAVDNFEQHLASKAGKYDGTEAQMDAMILYDKFFSLQASEPIGFDDKIRCEVESNICREGGPLPDCFATPKTLVLRTLEKTYFPHFLVSDLYFKYLNDLINTIQAHDLPLTRRKRAGSDASSEHSVGSQSTGSENVSVSAKNTLLAMDSSNKNIKKALGKIEDDMRMDAMLFNPDSLWKRTQQGNMTLGRINEVGQFISEFERDPDQGKKKKGTFFKKNKQKEKAQQEMALQIAQMIINDVTSVTSQQSAPPSPVSPT